MLRAVVMTAAVAFGAILVAGLSACEGSCEEKLSCPTGTSGAGAGGAGGASSAQGGGAAQSGSGGAAGGSSCGDGEVTPGELCFGALKSYSAGGEGVRDIALLDCDNDGDLDVAAAAETGVAILRNSDGALVELVSKWNWANAAVAAIDTDGVNLAVVHAMGGKTAWIVGPEPNQPCYFDGYGNWAAGSTDPGLGVSLALLGSAAEPDLVWLMAADGQDPKLHWQDMSYSTPAGVDYDTHAGVIEVGQVFGDAAEEVVFLNAFSRRVRVYSAADETLTLQGKYPPVQTLLEEPKVLALGDVDSDGDVDIAVGSEATNRVQFLHNGSDSLVLQLQEVDLQQAGGLIAMQLADADADGDNDLFVLVATAATDSDSVLLFLNDGSGMFAPAAKPFPIMVPNGTTAMSIVDMNGDGVNDIVVASQQGATALSLVLAEP